MKPKLTVMIAMYNSTQDVARTLEMLYVQKEPELEVVVVDDGSTEDTTTVRALCDSFGFRYIWQKNQGEAAARQRTLDESTGEYVTWVDADDGITTDYVDVILKELAEQDADIIFHRWRFIDGSVANDHEKPLTNWNVWANVYRRECVKDVKFDLNRQIASDYFWLEEAYKRCGTSYYSNNVVNIYNDKNPESLTHKFERGEVKALFSEE